MEGYLQDAIQALQGFTFFIRYNTATITTAHLPHVEVSHPGTKATNKSTTGSNHVTQLQVPHSHLPPFPLTSLPFISFFILTSF